MVEAYLSKIGLPYEAVTYITHAASNEMSWLNMSDAAQRGIRVTLLSSFAKETMAAIPTRYGDVIVTRDDPKCCRGRIRFRDQLVELALTGQVYAKRFTKMEPSQWIFGQRLLCLRTNARRSSIWL
jgi:hypothetical protein